jgi:EmrB/QacA subfamily drug resistance transporter
MRTSCAGGAHPWHRYSRVSAISPFALSDGVHTAMVAESTADRPTAERKRLILAACILGSTLVTVDSTVVNVALPAIREDLGGGFAGQQWTANAYLVTLASLILVGGSLGDVFGARRVFALGVAIFGVTSVLCAAAPSIEALVVARALQGVAGALLTPAALAIIVTTFSEEERGKAIGAWTAWGAIGFVLGPLIGGQLVDAASWRWIFAINLPLALATVALVTRVVPAGDSGRADGARVDAVGGVLCALGLAAATFGLIRQPSAGFGDPTVFLPLGGGILLFLLFLAYEARIRHPMLPLELFRRHNFAIGNLETLSMYAGLSLVSFFLVLFLQRAAGYSAIAAGTAILPVTMLLFVLSTRFGALADRYGPRLFMGAGPLVAALGMALMTRLDRHVDYLADLLPPLLVFGLGLAITVAPLTATVLAGADEHNAGVASGVNNAIARLAGLLGIAIVGAIVAARYGDSADSSEGAFHLAMAISATLVAAGGLLGWLIRNPDRKVDACDCIGGQLTGVPRDAAEHHRHAPAEVA